MSDYSKSALYCRVCIYWLWLLGYFY